MLPLKSAIKSFRRRPGFASVSILSLARALGLVAGVFGIVDAIRRPRTGSAIFTNRDEFPLIALFEIHRADQFARSA